jgi:multiple antibiotic resistance protein
LFGGIVIFTMAFMFIVNGKEWFIQMKSDLDDMATQLALPFMVGAGSISVSILVWNEFPLVEWLGLLIAVLCINWFAIVTIRMMQGRFFEWKLKPYFDKILSVFFRLNSFFMGAVGIDMIITAVKWLFGI